MISYFSRFPFVRILLCWMIGILLSGGIYWPLLVLPCIFFPTRLFRSIGISALLIVFAMAWTSYLKPVIQELGATYQARDILMRAVYFQSQATDAIIYNNAYRYINSDIDNKGWELTARTITSGYSIKSSVTLQDPRDVGQNLSQARRAKEYGSIDVSKMFSGYELGSRLYAASSRRDSNFTSNVLAGYATWSFYASRKIDNEWTARVNLENAFDRQYQLAYGYNTPGRGVYATLQYQSK